MNKYLQLAVLVSALLCGTTWGQTNRVGTLAPAQALVTVAGKYHYLGKLYYSGAERPREPRAVVVLNFMSLDCVPCRRELPEFLTIVREALKTSMAAGVRLRYFLVNVDLLSRKEELRKFLAGQGVTADDEVLLDPYRKTAEKLGVEGIPRTFVISPQGRITTDIVGTTNELRRVLLQGIQEALKDEGAQ